MIVWIVMYEDDRDIDSVWELITEALLRQSAIGDGAYIEGRKIGEIGLAYH